MVINANLEEVMAGVLEPSLDDLSYLEDFNKP
jgi:hypothetical protein